MKVTIIGSGRVGLTTGLAFDYLGHEVTFVDASPEVVAALRSRRLPFHDPSLEPLLSRSALLVLDAVTPEAASADVVMITVPTPGLSDGRADLSAVDAVVAGIGEALSEGTDPVVAIKSTVPPGTAQAAGRALHQALERRGVKAIARVASNPEFLRQGSALADTLYADRVVIGADDGEAERRLLDLYDPVIRQSFPAPPHLPRPEGLEVRVLCTHPVNAELIKYGTNAFLAAKVTFINEIARIAERLGADVTEVARGLGLDPRIGGQYLQAGPGWGGPCLGKDSRALAALASDLGERTPLLDAVQESNEIQRRRIVERVEEALGTLEGATIGLLGLSFKPGTDDVTDSPALAVAAALIERRAAVHAYDPAGEERALEQLPAIVCHPSAREMLEGCDAVVVMTDWPEFRHLRWERPASGRGLTVIDARNCLDRAAVEGAGFRYVGLGR